MFSGGSEELCVLRLIIRWLRFTEHRRLQLKQKHRRILGKDLQIAKNAVKNSAEVRADKVADLKQKIESGNYNVDMDDFASVLLSKFGK